MTAQLVTPATAWPVSLEEAVVWCRAEGMAHHEALIQSLIVAATGHVEALLGISIAPAGWELWLDAFPAAPAAIELPMGPVVNVSAITVFDAAGAETTVASDVYVLDLVSRFARIQLRSGKQWPEVGAELNGVKVAFTVGMSAPPADLKTALLQLVAHWYDSPDKAGAVPDGIRKTLSPWRRIII